MDTLTGEYVTELKNIKRTGIQELFDWLTSSDFFVAPASSKFHGAYEGGLALHCLSVLDIMKSLNKNLELKISPESIVICALFHDVCKVNYYVLDDEPATKAQIEYVTSLCEQNKKVVPKKVYCTKAYVGKVIAALKEKKEIPEFTAYYRVVDQFPMGHGEKSVYLINKYMTLTDEEALSIRWHLGGFDPSMHFNFPNGYPAQQAFREHKLVAFLASADLAASYLVDD